MSYVVKALIVDCDQSEISHFDGSGRILHWVGKGIVCMCKVLLIGIWEEPDYFASKRIEQQHDRATNVTQARKQDTER